MKSIVPQNALDIILLNGHFRYKMIVGIMSIDIIIRESNSLKDKRHVVKSLLDTIRSRFNVSASEVDKLDKLRGSVLAVSCVSNDKKVVESMLNRILQLIESDPRIEVKDCQLEIL